MWCGLQGSSRRMTWLAGQVPRTTLLPVVPSELVTALQLLLYTAAGTAQYMLQMLSTAVGQVMQMGMSMGMPVPGLMVTFPVIVVGMPRAMVVTTEQHVTQSEGAA